MNKSFCIAPWVSSYVNSKGSRELCCVSKKKSGKSENWISLRDYKNSDYILNIKKEMLNGIVPEDCLYCEGGSNYRDFFNKEFSDRIPEIFEKFKRGEVAKSEEVHLDYRISKCNLMCRTCGEGESSTWQEHLLKHNTEYSEIGYKVKNLKDRITTRLKNQKKYEEEFLDLIKMGRITHIYFAGGEPFLRKDHLNELEKIIESGYSKNILLIYNVNLMISKSFLEGWLKKVPYFKRVHLSISIDGYKEIGEYIRTGLNWNIFEENLNILKNRKMPNLNLALDPTFTSVLLTDLKRFSDFCLETKLPLQAKIMLGREDYATAFRLEFFPTEIRKKLIADWLQYYDALNLEEKKQLIEFKKLLIDCCGLNEFSKNEIVKHLKIVKKIDILHGKGDFESILNANSITKMWLSRYIKI